MKQKSTYSAAKATDSVDSLWVRIDEIDQETAAFLERKRKEKQAIYEVLKQKTNALVSRTHSNIDPPRVLYTKRKFGTLDCDPDQLYSLLTVDYKVILPMDIADFKLAFSGSSDPKTPIVCLNARLFINILFWIQSKAWLPLGTLNVAVYEQCLNRKGKKIPPHNIEEEFSKSRNQDSHLITDAIIQKLRSH